MTELYRKKILVVDLDLPHIYEIGNKLKECAPDYLIDVRPKFSFINFTPKDFDAIFVCSSYLQDCRLNLLEIKSHQEAKNLKIFALFEKSICPSRDEEYCRENGIDDFLSLPFDKETLHQKLEN